MIRSLSVPRCGVPRCGRRRRPWTPAEWPELAGWWRSDSGVTLNGSAVSAWANRKAHALGVGALAQGTALWQPAYNASDPLLGGFPSVTTDGSLQWLATTTFDASAYGTAYIAFVGRPTGGTSAALYYLSLARPDSPAQSLRIHSGSVATQIRARLYNTGGFSAEVNKLIASGVSLNEAWFNYATLPELGLFVNTSETTWPNPLSGDAEKLSAASLIGLGKTRAADTGARVAVAEVFFATAKPDAATWAGLRAYLKSYHGLTGY